MPDPLPFGHWLKRLRADLDLTQEALAEAVGCAPQTIRTFESGARRPSHELAERMASVLHVPIAQRADFVRLARTPAGSALARPTGGKQKTLDPRPNKLPVQRRPLIGRERELQVVRQLLLRSDVGIVTLTGPGGIGKTRLALQVAADLLHDFADGIWFVELAPISDPALVVSTITAALGLKDVGGQRLHDNLRAYLAEKQLLLVLDNFEHVMAAAPEVADLLATCPCLAILVTSRAPLRLRDEQEYPVAPLALPSLDYMPGVDAVAVSPAVQLFVQHAQTDVPDFVLTPANAATVATICRRLDGLPLAIELAAARVKLLGTTVLLARLDPALPLLVSGARDVPERQQTMRHAIAWSYDLLAAGKQALFRQLAVFAGGWTLEAVEALVAPACRDGAEVVNSLDELVDQSLVVVEPADGAVRYRLLETIQAYALEQLEARGEAAAVRRRHAELYLELAETARGELRGPRQVEWLRKLETEHANLRAAMAWALEQQNHEVAVRLGWALWMFWWFLGHHAEGRRWMETLLVRDLEPAQRVIALGIAALMAYTQGDYETCERYGPETIALAQQVGDALGLGLALNGMGLLAMQRGNYQLAASWFQDALSTWQAAGDDTFLSETHAYLGTIALLEGDGDRALRLFEEALALARRTGDRAASIIALYNLGLVAQARQDWATAAQRFFEGIGLSVEMGDRANLAYCLEGLAVVAGVCGQMEHAARLFGVAAGLIEYVGATVYNQYQPDRLLYERTRSAVRSMLGARAWEAASAEGRTLTSEQAVALARQVIDNLSADVAEQKLSRAIDQSLATDVTPSLLQPSLHGQRPDLLTDRELEVLQLLAAGRSNRAMAVELVVAVGTVKRHVSNIMDKLQVQSRLEAVARARDLGLV